MLTFEYASIAASVSAAAAALFIGVAANSVSLVAFGLGAVLCFAFSAVALWQIRVSDAEPKQSGSAAATEQRILFVLGLTSLLIALYVLSEAGSRLFFGERPDVSPAGFILALAFLPFAIVLAGAKRKVLRAAAGGVLATGAFMTVNCAFLALFLLFAQSGRLWYGWWWSDGVGGMLMILPFVNAGWSAVKRSKEQP